MPQQDEKLVARARNVVRTRTAALRKLAVEEAQIRSMQTDLQGIPGESIRLSGFEDDLARIQTRSDRINLELDAARPIVQVAGPERRQRRRG